MLLHFIFVEKESDVENRKNEFEYVKKMAEFYKVWIKKKFSKEIQVKCDEMITKPRRLLDRIDIPTLVRDHRERGEDVFHFYLCNFRPIWTDCTCEGYHAENFCMIWWQPPKTHDDLIPFLAEKNCTTVSHEITHEMLRQRNYKRYVDDVHDVWTRHFFDNLAFERYDKNFQKTSGKPYFLTLNTSFFQLK